WIDGERHVDPQRADANHREDVVVQETLVRRQREEAQKGKDRHASGQDHRAHGDGVDRALAEAILELLAEDPVEGGANEGEERDEPEPAHSHNLLHRGSEGFGHGAMPHEWRDPTGRAFVTNRYSFTRFARSLIAAQFLKVDVSFASMEWKWRKMERTIA